MAVFSRRPGCRTALFFLAAEMLGENAKRLNRVPLNNLVSFLDLLQVSLQPARPAKAHVVFSLNEGVREPVFVPGGTVIAAAAEDGGEDIPFETESALLVTPAKLTDLLNVNPARDRIVLSAEQYDEALAANAAPEIPLFSVEGVNLQEHVFYLRHDDLFRLDHPARLILKWHNAEKRYVETELAAVAGRSDWMEWSYSQGDEWIPFEDMSVSGREVTLRKKSSGPVEETVIGGISGRWIRCRIRPAADGVSAPEALGAVPDMDRITLRASHDRQLDAAGIPADELYFNDTQLDGAGFAPFGEHFLPYAVFYAACPEALSKRGSRLTMTFKGRVVPSSLRSAPDPEIKWKMVMRTFDFEKKPLPRILIRKVQWEYWNGDNWMKLQGTARYDELFAQMPEEETDYRLEFDCPEDLAPAYVNGREDRWIRARVLAVDPISAPVVEYMSPWLSAPAFSYAYDDSDELIAQSAFTLNNAELRDVTATARQGGATFKPFVPIACPSPALYAGFDSPPLKGPIRLQFTLGRKVPAEGEAPWIEWEACVRSAAGGWKWVALKTSDDTEGFTENGTLQFVGPAELAPVSLFGRERVWLRALNRDGKYGEAGAAVPTAASIRRNSVAVVQRQTITGEYPERGRGGFVLSRSPVISEEIWVDETGHVAEHELERQLEAAPERYEVYRDSDGGIQRLWVRWERVRSFGASTSDDRHYTLDSASGLLQFGNGTRGMKPPQDGGDKIRATYRVTEGLRGNTAAGTITNLLQPIAFVERAVNPAPAVGGGDTEPLDGALRRGPQQLKHRGRAISASDAEWLVREIDPGIVKVRCLPNRDARMQRKPGSLAVAVLPAGGREASEHFPAVKRKLEAELRERASNLVATGGRLTVMLPVLLEVSVTATVAVDSPDFVMPAESMCLERLSRFLDPVTGKSDGQGWEIGEPVHPSVFYGLLQSVRGVQRVEQVHLNVFKLENGVTTEIPAGSLGDLPHGIVTSGTHRVNVVIG
ncbi:hypothetical protein D3H35_18070 [Cohnella faecalis]|uniref:Uncharacterized protein n=1 Tax=Cohnella faecalis TaxID=2315694 RepID=A0A398CJV7_9BACL|nr:hypothetical protein D3H35_18070 [Cohnella faecalis]